MKLKLSYIGINTDNPTPILITENGMAVTADRQAMVKTEAQLEAFLRSVTRWLDADLKAKIESQSRSTIDQDKAK